MENCRSFVLQPVNEGDIVYVTACSQCASTAKISVTGLEKDIVLEKTDNRTDLLELEGACKTSKCKKGDVKLNITIKNEDSQMRVIKTACVMSDNEGVVKGINFAFYIDDQEKGDSDFNDYYINIAVWRKQG